MTEKHGAGLAYRVDLRLRPEGQRGPLAMSLPAMLALLRRPRPDLGAAGLHQGPARRRRPRAWAASSSTQLQPWIYRRYLSRADISGIKALKRRIEQQTHREGGATPAT